MPLPLLSVPPMRFEHRVCQVQSSRLTYVNGQWQGRMDPVHAAAGEALASCPFEWDYLATAGEDGWELVAGIGSGADNARVLYLKRVVPAGV